MTQVSIPLRGTDFAETERQIAATAKFSITGFRYPTGVAALRIVNARGEIVVLPFQGQQIWDARFDERRLTMKSMFESPRPTQDFLQTYGALLIHCGATAVGPPGPGDDHPPHGELPNAPMDGAMLTLEDDTLTISGTYRHTVAFQTDYVFRPSIRLCDEATAMTVTVEIENLKRSDMELFYLAHVNFRAEDGLHIHDNCKSLRLRETLPSHVTPTPEFGALIADLKKEPDRHRHLEPGLGYDPEIVLFPEFTAPQAHALAVHMDGSADFIRYETEALPKALRWISRTPDQNCLGLVLPATCEGEGRMREIEKGNVTWLRAGETFSCTYEFGLIAANDVNAELMKLNA